MGRRMKRFFSIVSQTPAELAERIRSREDEAMRLPPDTDSHRKLMREIARLQISVDAKRWLRRRR